MKKIERSVIILAGGKSKRLNGFPKSHLLYSSRETFIEKILKETKDFKEVIISSNSPFLFKDFKGEIYEDDIKDIGPIGGIYTCLKRIKTEEALVISVDMPKVKKDFLNTLGRVEVKGDCIIPIWDGNMEPLCGIYSKKMLPLIERHIKLKDYQIRSLVKDSKACYIAVKEKDLFLNINTFEEYYKM